MSPLLGLILKKKFSLSTKEKSNFRYGTQQVKSVFIQSPKLITEELTVSSSLST